VTDSATNGVRVQVRSRYVEERSAPRDERYFFVYHVTIINERHDTLYLIRRHWVITDANGLSEEVSGPGVAGEQPVLKPRMAFDYTSFCTLKTPVGSMHGTYTMVTEARVTFPVRIAPFTLAVPNAVN
jgi:ApaG protein